MRTGVLKSSLSLGRGQQFCAGSVAHDAAVAHENDALDLGQNVAEMMRHQDEAGALCGQAAKDLAQFALRGQIERIGRLIEKKLARAVHQCARDEDAALLAGRHFADELLGEMQRLHPLQRFDGALAHFLGDMEIGPQR